MKFCKDCKKGNRLNNLSNTGLKISNVKLVKSYFNPREFEIICDVTCIKCNTVYTAEWKLKTYGVK